MSVGILVVLILAFLVGANLGCIIMYAAYRVGRKRELAEADAFFERTFRGWFADGKET